jgi:hypothetical protein
MLVGRSGVIANNVSTDVRSTMNRNRDGQMFVGRSGVIATNVSTNVRSTINRNWDVGKCSQVGRPPRIVSARQHEQVPWR